MEPKIIYLFHLSTALITPIIRYRRSQKLSVCTQKHLTNLVQFLFQPIINNLINPGGSNGNIQSLSFANEYCQPVSPLLLTPTLMEAQISRLAEAAERLVKNFPLMDLKLANNKKRISKDLEVSDIP